MSTSRPALFPSAFHPHLGGVEELTKQLGLALVSKDMVPLVVVNRWPRSLPAEDAVAGLAVRRLPFRVPGAEPRKLGGWAVHAGATHRDTVRQLAEWSADLVHVQCVSSNAPFATRASRRLGLPLVVTAQGELSMDADRLYQRSSVARTILRRAVTAADVVTGCSQYVIDELDRFTGGLHRGKMRVIYNGIDVEECAAARPECRERPYVLGLGRLVPQKGYEVLIRAFAVIAADFPDHELLIAGDGPERARLGGLIAALGLAKRAHLLGAVDHSRALGLFAGSSVFVLCSHHEPQGIVILEAMAAGAPVLATAVGGVPEVIDESNGLLWPAGDHHALADRLRYILRDSGSALRFSAAGRITASRFAWSEQVRGYEEAYAAAASGNF